RRSSAARADRGECLGCSAGPIFARLDVYRARSLDGLRQLLELSGEGLELADEEAALAFGDRFGGIDERLEHHCDARQDRFLDPLERLVEACLLVDRWHDRQFGTILVKSW